MSDFLLELNNHPRAKKLIKSLGLPLPMPQNLERTQSPWEDNVLSGKSILIHAPKSSKALAAIAQTLTQAKGEVFTFQNSPCSTAVKKACKDQTRLVHTIEDKRDENNQLITDQKFNGLIFDASSLKTSEDLTALHSFFQPVLSKLKSCGRILVIGTPPESLEKPLESATQMALSGFTRSLAKEWGKKGITAQCLYVSKGAEAYLEGPVRFFLSPRSAYVTAQPVLINKPSKPIEGGTPWSGTLNGKVALVTGAARGIGAATARLLAGEGAKVICLDRPEDQEAAEALIKEIKGDGLFLDVTDSQAPKKILDYVNKTYGGLDVIIHNAGITRDKTLLRMPPKYWEQTLDVNLGAINRITEALIQNEGGLKDFGRIVCLSSVSGIAGNMGQTNYAASKAGVIGYIRSLSLQLADRGITVNAIAPGFIETRMTAAIPMAIREAGRRLNALSQGGQPEDVGQALTFLSTPGSEGITGQVIRVCGGALIGA